MESYELAAFPPNQNMVNIAYFENVTNAPEIRERLVEAARANGPEGTKLREAVDFAFVDRDMLVSKVHLTSSIMSALLGSLPDAREATLPAPPVPNTRSYNIHSEVLMALSPNNNITDAIRRFGISEATTRLVVVRIGPIQPEASVYAGIEAVVKGELKEVESLDDPLQIKWGNVDKVYKLGEMNQLKTTPEDLVKRKIDAVVNIVAVKRST